MSYKYRTGEEYTSRNQSQIDSLNKQLLNRGAFSYDADADEAYRDYANLMRAEANKAMKDTVAKINASSGGYGNSFAATAGQQVYNDYVSQIGAAEQTYYDRALAKYQMEGNELQNKLSTLQNQESADRSAWEADYARDWNEAQNQATYGNYSGLSDLTGISEEDFIKANRPVVGEAELEGFKNALMNGKGQDYFDFLVKMGYNTANLYNIAESWGMTGELGGTITINNKDDDDPTNNTITYTANPADDPFAVNSNALTDVNNSIDGIGNLKAGQNFHIARTKEDSYTSDNWDIQLGEEITGSTDEEYAPLLKKAKELTTNNGLLLYNNQPYYINGGRVFKVDAQFWHQDEYDELVQYLKDGINKHKKEQ